MQKGFSGKLNRPIIKCGNGRVLFMHDVADRIEREVIWEKTSPQLF